MLLFTLILFGIFLIFQIAYIFIPLFVVKEREAIRPARHERSITVLIPAYNEEQTILHCVQGLIRQEYKNYEVIIINDGSTDRTLEVLKHDLDLQRREKPPASQLVYNPVKAVYQSTRYPYIFVLDKVNGGKADALNAGIDYASHEIVITLDADSILDGKALQAINAAFEDERVLAVGGMVNIRQGYRSIFARPRPTFVGRGLIRYQIIQYLTAFYLHKLTQSKLQTITVIAGAFGAFRRSVLVEVNGYRKTVGEDMDITLKIQQLIATKFKDGRINFVPHAICYTECPATFKDLFRQRIRWQKAFVDCILHYRKAYFRTIRPLATLYLLLDSLLLGTLNAFILVMVFIALIWFGDNYMIALGLFVTVFFLGSYQGMVTLLISRRFGMRYSIGDYVRLLTFISIEIITYRLLGIPFVIIGTILYFRNRQEWAVSRRAVQPTYEEVNVAKESLMWRLR